MIRSAMYRALKNKYPIVSTCEIFGVKPEAYAEEVVKLMGEEAKDICVLITPYVMRVSIHVVALSKEAVWQ